MSKQFTAEQIATATLEELKEMYELAAGQQKARIKKRINKLEKETLNETVKMEETEQKAETEQKEEETEQAEQKAEEMKEEKEITMVGGLGRLKQLTDEIQKKDKGERIELSAANNPTIELLFKEKGLYAMIGKDAREMEESIYYSKLNLAKRYEIDGVKNYSMAYKDIQKTFSGKTGKIALKAYKENTIGDVILVSVNAEKNGGKYATKGKTALFVRPKGENIITLDGKGGTQIKITYANWDKEPLAMFSDAGRATKYAQYVAITYNLDMDFERKATEKYQPEIKKKFLGKNWLLLTEYDGKLYGLTRNNNIKELKNTNIQNGWRILIKELQEIAN